MANRFNRDFVYGVICGVLVTIFLYVCLVLWQLQQPGL